MVQNVGNYPNAAPCKRRDHALGANTLARPTCKDMQRKENAWSRALRSPSLGNFACWTRAEGALCQEALAPRDARKDYV